MTDDQIANLIYLGLLLAALGGYVVVQARRAPGQTLRHALLWGLIFVGLIAAVGLWSDIRSTVTPRQMVQTEGRIEVPISPDGHFYLIAAVNGTPIRFAVDTGASDIVLSRDDAARAGIDPDQLAYTGLASTANGTVATAPVRLQTFELGDLVQEDLRAVVNGGELDGSLLGMSYLSRFRAVTLQPDRLILAP